MATLPVAPVHYRPDGFHGAILAAGAHHRFNPPARPGCNAAAESSQAAIENGFFGLGCFLPFKMSF
ncbi:MAG: hypothetical protein LBC18_10350 [Opitutaceae bacterium]|nr:hypothetical protein [Opitutaceae bacterium]